MKMVEGCGADGRVAMSMKRRNRKLQVEALFVNRILAAVARGTSFSLRLGRIGRACLLRLCGLGRVPIGLFATALHQLH